MTKLTLTRALSRLAPTREMIADVERVLRVWRGRVKAREAKAESLRRHKDPDFRARHRAGIDQFYADPAKETARIAKMRATRARKPGAFPLGFNVAMRSKVGRLVRKGASRAEAIAAVAAEYLNSTPCAPHEGVPLSPGRPRRGSPPIAAVGISLEHR